jgi:hypothetical protein
LIDIRQRAQSVLLLASAQSKASSTILLASKSTLVIWHRVEVASLRGIGPVPPVSVSSENRRSFQNKEQPRLRSGSRSSHLNVVLSKAAHSCPSVCLRVRALCPLRVSLASERIAQRAVCSCDLCVAADPPSYRLRRSGAYSSRITWECSKGCRPAFRWLLGSR